MARSFFQSKKSVRCLVWARVGSYQQLRSGQLPSLRLGGAVKVKREDLEAYIQNQCHSSQE
jgi:hypothetical protein